MEKARRILEKHGATVEDVELLEDFRKVLDWHAVVMATEGKASFLGQYLTDKIKLHDDIVGYAENKQGVSHQQQLEAYDNCARLRPIWDELARRFDVILTPSIIDEAPVGPENTGDMVGSPRTRMKPKLVETLLTVIIVILLDLDNHACPSSQHTRVCWREWYASWVDSSWSSIYGQTSATRCKNARSFVREGRRLDQEECGKHTHAERTEAGIDRVPQHLIAYSNIDSRNLL